MDKRKTLILLMALMWMMRGTAMSDGAEQTTPKEGMALNLSGHLWVGEKAEDGVLRFFPDGEVQLDCTLPGGYPDIAYGRLDVEETQALILWEEDESDNLTLQGETLILAEDSLYRRGPVLPKEDVVWIPPEEYDGPRGEEIPFVQEEGEPTEVPADALSPQEARAIISEHLTLESQEPLRQGGTFAYYFGGYQELYGEICCSMDFVELYDDGMRMIRPMWVTPEGAVYEESYERGFPEYTLVFPGVEDGGGEEE